MTSKGYAYALWLALLASDTAFAHSPIEGIGNFYNGLLHPVFVPAHLLLLIAVGLLLGQQEPKPIETVLGIFAFAILAGLTGAWFSISTEMEAFILVLATATGLLIAINPGIKLLWCIAIAVLAGFFLGIDSAQETLSGKEKLVSLFGSGVAIYFLLLYPMVLAEYFKKNTWQRTGIRIVGSWVAASSLLVLALSFSKVP